MPLALQRPQPVDPPITPRYRETFANPIPPKHPHRLTQQYFYSQSYRIILYPGTNS